jgi:ATP-dependent Clp protease ATP-binding subunit ClpX
VTTDSESKRPRLLDGEDRAKQGVTCSFCGKSAAQVNRLLAGSAAFICDECIEKCSRALHKNATPDS